MRFTKDNTSIVDVFYNYIPVSVSVSLLYEDIKTVSCHHITMQSLEIQIDLTPTLVVVSIATS